MSDKDKINQYAQSVLDMFDGENSAILVLSLLSVIESVSENEKSTAPFRKQTAELLEDQAFRVRSSMRVQRVAP